ncbi:putative late blight resistance protein homolog R1B-8 [Andrographis paniculata]|uniref:putative late blight resistance protein homolog R1B-8 n=1 Tax=Andrographis paniculata TaxID=175694 RepID=UPI0021E85A98|nr:putative late blight resistance protein homolog R1B-8 [Andrographis paniculata]
MAYNLESLAQILHQLLLPDHHSRRPWFLDPSQTSDFQSLLTKSYFLRDFFQHSSSSITPPQARTTLESRIRDAACHAEAIISSHLADKLTIPRIKGQRVMIPFPDLLRVINDIQFERILEDIVKLMDESHQTQVRRRIDSTTESSQIVSTSQFSDLNPDQIVLGLADDLIQLKHRLLGQDPDSKLEILPIVGMGGIGKTTLARTLYDDPVLTPHFDIRGWVTISQTFNVREILLSLIKQVSPEKLTDEIIKKDDSELIVRLYQNLWGRRFLIVLDDVWSPKVWDEIKTIFPDEATGSRIVVTTRERSVANFVAGNDEQHHMKFLNESESWNLFCRKVFVEKPLINIGRKIAKGCRGLPLAIHVVGGVLARADRTIESWRRVADDVCSTMANSDAQFSNILSLSYNHLPDYLRPCFLYMSTFPEDHEIQSSKLVNLWVAEGFLKPISGKSLEDAAEVYLKELVERNLLLVCKIEAKRNVKTYIMHDLLRDLCLRKAEEEKFVFVVGKSIRGFIPSDAAQLRRLSVRGCNREACFHESVDLASVTHTFLLNSLNCSYFVDPDQPHLYVFRMRLLKVLDILALKLVDLPESVEQLVNLRYIAARFQLDSKLPSSISALCNLQTLIFSQEQYFGATVEEILFEMPEFLRHVRYKGIYPLYHVRDGEWEKLAVQENLQTLSYVAVDNQFPKILEATPNLKTLGIFEHEEMSLSVCIDLSRMDKLEVLKCRSLSTYPKDEYSTLLCFLILAPWLKKLSLRNLRIPPKWMGKVGALHNLQILKLRGCIFRHLAWEPSEGEFVELRLLVLENLDLMKWEADATHYPRLEHLVIRDCGKLEIPCDLGNIMTLETIELHRPTLGLRESARKIQDEQAELGNDSLQVRYL